MNAELREFARVSVSQIQMFQRCRRLWWLRYIKGLPQEDKDYFHFGTGLHTLIENWLKADDNGRDEDGKPVEIFTPGWDEVRDKGKVVYRYTDAERQWVKHLFEYAVENGVLQRRPGRKMEFEIKRPVLPGIELIGYIDVLHPDEIWDHKTAKNRKYAKGKTAAQKDMQLKTYAAVALQLAREGGGAIPARITARFNNFLKDQDDPKPVYFVEVEYTAQELDLHWLTVQEIVAEMQRCARVQNITDLPEPSPGTCLDMGGCPYLPLCGNRESYDGYIARVKSINQRRHERFATPSNVTPNRVGGLNIMGTFDHLRKGTPAAAAAPQQTAPPAHGPLNSPFTPRTAPAAAAAAPTTAAPPAAAPAPTTAAPSSTGHPRAPWHVPGCGACSVAGSENPILGFDSNGGPCRVCDARARSRGLPTSDGWIISGPFEYTAKTPAPTAAAVVAAPTQSLLPPMQTAPIPAPGAEDAPAAPQTAAASAPAGEAPKRKPGRPRKNPAEAAIPQEQPTGSAPAQTAAAAAALAPDTAAEGLLAQALKENAAGEPTGEETLVDAKPLPALGAASFDSSKAVPIPPPGGVAQKTLFNPHGAGRRARRYTLMIGCLPLKQPNGKNDYLLADDLFRAARERYETEKGIKTYWDGDPFKRIDAMVYIAEQLVDALGQSTIVAVGNGASRDEKAFIHALRTNADFVAVATIA